MPKPSESQKVIACIIVRMKSSRLPQKALADIEGKSMTYRIIERLQTAQTIHRIVICTSSHPDDEVLVEKAKNVWGVEAVAGSELDVLSRLMQAADRFQAGIVVRITGDNPFTDASLIDKMVQHHMASGADFTRTIGLPLGVTADILSADMLPKLHKRMEDPNQSEYLQMFAIDPDHFKCELLVAPPEINRPFYSLTVDTPEDIKWARYLYKKLSSEGGIPALSDVVAELDNNPDYKGVPEDAPVKMPNGKSITYIQFIEWLKAQTRATKG